MKKTVAEDYNTIVKNLTGSEPEVLQSIAKKFPMKCIAPLVHSGVPYGPGDTVVFADEFSRDYQKSAGKVEEIK